MTDGEREIVAKLQERVAKLAFEAHAVSRELGLVLGNVSGRLAQAEAELDRLAKERDAAAKAAAEKKAAKAKKAPPPTPPPKE